MTRVRRRFSRQPSAEKEWGANREWMVPRAIRSGLGVRPEAWWRYEVDRPDLAEGAGLDPFVHLSPNPRLQDAAVERLRYLATHRQLTRGELAAIFAAESDERALYGPAKRWRALILRQARIRP